jgi:hypothetical protein
LGRRAAVSIAVVYIVIDMLIMFGAGALARMALIETLSYGTKLGAAWLGAHANSSASSPRPS